MGFIQEHPMFRWNDEAKGRYKRLFGRAAVEEFGWEAGDIQFARHLLTQLYTPLHGRIVDNEGTAREVTSRDRVSNVSIWHAYNNAFLEAVREHQQGIMRSLGRDDVSYTEALDSLLPYRCWDKPMPRSVLPRLMPLIWPHTEEHKCSLANDAGNGPQRIRGFAGLYGPGSVVVKHQGGRGPDKEPRRTRFDWQTTTVLDDMAALFYQSPAPKPGNPTERLDAAVSLYRSRQALEGLPDLKTYFLVQRFLVALYHYAPDKFWAQPESAVANGSTRRRLR